MIPTITENGAVKKETHLIVTGQEEPEKDDIQMPFLKTAFVFKVLTLHLAKCILFFLPSPRITVCSVSSLRRERGYL